MTPVSVLVVSQSHSCSVCNCDMLQLVRDLLAVTLHTVCAMCCCSVRDSIHVSHVCLLTVIH